MGGRFGESVRLYRAISQVEPDAMAQNVADYSAEGYTRFQLKVGGDPDTDIKRIHAARAVLKDSDRLVADASSRFGCVHRATLFELPRVFGGSSSHRQPVCAGRKR